MHLETFVLQYWKNFENSCCSVRQPKGKHLKNGLILISYLKSDFHLTNFFNSSFSSHLQQLVKVLWKRCLFIIHMGQHIIQFTFMFQRVGNGEHWWCSQNIKHIFNLWINKIKYSTNIFDQRNWISRLLKKFINQIIGLTIGEKE